MEMTKFPSPARAKYVAVLKGAATIGVAWSLAAGASVVSMLATAAPAGSASAVQTFEPSPNAKLHLDRSGQMQTGKASFYKNSYAGKKMADGTPMRLYSDNAASITLPLGTTAKVTNLETG